MSDSKFIADQTLIEAAEAGDVNAVGAALENQDFGALRSAANDAFTAAAQNGHLPVMEKLIEYYEDYYQSTSISSQACKESLRKFDLNKAFREAAQNGHRDCVEFLHKCGVNIRQLDDFAIRNAKKNGHDDVVAYLVEKGVDLKAATPSPTGTEGFSLSSLRKGLQGPG